MADDPDGSSNDADRPLAAGAIAASATCFLLGIPICAIGVSGLRAAGAGGSTQWASVAWLVVGAALCAAGMWFKGGEPTRGG